MHGSAGGGWGGSGGGGGFVVQESGLRSESLTGKLHPSYLSENRGINMSEKPHYQTWVERKQIKPRKKFSSKPRFGHNQSHLQDAARLHRCSNGKTDAVNLKTRACGWRNFQPKKIKLKLKGADSQSSCGRCVNKYYKMALEGRICTVTQVDGALSPSVYGVSV